MRMRHWLWIGGLLCSCLSVTPVFSADPVKVVIITDADGKNKTKSYPGGVRKSDLTEAEVKSVTDEVNANIKKEIGEGLINIVPPTGNGDVPYKIYVIGNYGSRGLTFSNNNEIIVNEGTLKGDAGDDRMKLVNAIVFTIKHELVHLIGGLADKDHGDEKSQSVKDDRIKSTEKLIEKQKAKANDPSTPPAKKAQLEGLIKHNSEKVLPFQKAEVVKPINEFTRGENISKDDLTNAASQNYPDKAKEALKSGVEKIQKGAAPNLPPAPPAKLGQLVPVLGPDNDQNIGRDNFADYGFRLESGLLGSDPNNPRFELGMFDASGAFVPFESSWEPNALSGAITLEAGYYYQFVLEDHLTGTFISSTDSSATVSFNELLRFDSAFAAPFGQLLTGDYFGAAYIDYLVSGGSVHVVLESQNIFTEDGGDGFIDPFHSSPDPNAMALIAPVPEPSSFAIWGMTSIMLIVFPKKKRALLS